MIFKNEHPGLISKRKWPRHDVMIPVSVKCNISDNEDASWYVGEASNLSVEGFTIQLNPLPEIAILSSVEILCFPDKFPMLSHVAEPEPVCVTGQVIWKDAEKHLVGIEITS